VAAIVGCGEPVRKNLATNEPQGAWSDDELAAVRDGEETTLSAPNATVTDEDLGRLAGLDKLEALLLDDVKITDAGLAHLAGLTAITRLHVADETSGHAAVGDDGIQALGGLTNLEELGLPSRNATDAAAETLATLTKLKMLNLGVTQMTDAGVERLATLPDLEFLRLGGSQLTDKSMEHFAKMTKLRKLLIHDAPFTDAGLPHLVALENIESLYINGTRITEAGLSVLPEWHIHFNDAHVRGEHGHDP
jgi:Leucine-rich repeat (LRR) protein